MSADGKGSKDVRGTKGMKETAGAADATGARGAGGAGDASVDADLGRHRSMAGLIAYSLPAIAMMVFTSIYGIVDGFFISNFVGKTAFAAVNLILPVAFLLGSFGFMFGTGGSALIAKTLGEGDERRANGYFTLVVCVAAVVGVIAASLGAILMEPIARLLGASDDMLGTAVLYGRMNMISLPGYVLQYMFQALFMTAGKPRLGFAVTVLAGVLNMVLDALFVGVLHWGVVGAAAATNIAELTGGIVPLVYFMRRNASLLRLTRPAGGARVILKVAGNGSSEMVSSIATAVVSMVYNLQLMSLIGEDGVSAYGVIMYTWMVFSAVFLGYDTATAPLMSYSYGARDVREMQSLFRKGLAFMVGGGVLMLVLSHVLARPLSALFVGYDEGLLNLTTHAYRIYSFAYLLTGFNVFGSSLFTALNNGGVSAATSFLRTFVFEVGAVLLLPMLIGADGVWASIIVAEVAAAVLNAVLIVWLAPQYGYLRRGARKAGRAAGATRS